MILTDVDFDRPIVSIPLRIESQNKIAGYQTEAKLSQLDASYSAQIAEMDARYSQATENQAMSRQSSCVAATPLV